MSAYQPKGGMCITCANNRKDCSALPFSDMKPIKTYPDGVIAVRCAEHASAKQGGKDE